MTTIQAELRARSAREQDPLPLFLTAARAARELGIATRTFRDMVSRGVLPAPVRFSRRTIRWPRAAIEALAGEHQ